MSDVNTFDSSKPDNGKTVSIYDQQKQGVSQMREALLASVDGTLVVSAAMQRVTALRIFHQMNRVIQYTEMMDKLESKLYEALDYTITATDITNRHDLVILVGLQERIQKNMIDSFKLLQPYLENQDWKLLDDLVALKGDISDLAMTPDGRDHLRVTANTVLKQLRAG